MTAPRISRDGATDPGRRDLLKAAAGSALFALVGGPLSGCGGSSESPPPPTPTPLRYKCLYNGYLLTVNPARALAVGSPDDRHRLYVLLGLLMDPVTGRILGVYPPLEDGQVAGEAAAGTLDDHADLRTQEEPAAPGITLAEARAYFLEAGASETLLQHTDFVDLEGRVCTPGLIDDHFHVTSWSKKIPDPGEEFGYWADVSEPRFYYVPGTEDRRCAQDGLWEIVTEANGHLERLDEDRIFLHGYWNTQTFDVPESTPQPYLFLRGPDCPGSAGYDPAFLLNHVARPGPALGSAPADRCGAEPAGWPALTGGMRAALLVHTSGQVCWFNGALLEAFNADQQTVLGTAFGEVPMLPPVAPAEAGEPWTLALQGVSADGDLVLGKEPPFKVDLKAVGADTLHLPLTIVDTNAGAGPLQAEPVLPELDYAGLIAQSTTFSLVPYYRDIPACISATRWNDAATFREEVGEAEDVGYGSWDPRHAHETNWYNGAERGLIQYFYDDQADAWRPTGFAEHYVMRDALGYYATRPLDIPEAMQQRRNLATWCHRHGITAVQDIMFYRRSTNTEEFDACHGLSFDHGVDPGDTYYDNPGIDASIPTGDLKLRLGLYYYLENLDHVTPVLDLAHNADGGGYDVERLAAPAGHPEQPGWVRWLGWKLQLDGGTGARTLFSNAPMAKPPHKTDPYEMQDELGNPRTFFNHSFGLLTMSNEKEVIFTSRETAALYWLVREGSGGVGPAFNDQILGDWAWLKDGVLGWLDVDPAAGALDDLEHDLGALENVDLIVDQAPPDGPPVNQPADLAAKIASLVSQAQDGYQRTLTTIARLWYEKSQAAANGRAMPSQVVCHCIGDGAVNLWLRAIRQLKTDVATFPMAYDALPDHWKDALPDESGVVTVHTAFQDERFRVEHLLNVSPHAIAEIRTPLTGIDAGSTPATRNVVFSTQPSLLGLDGEGIRQGAFPIGQELWDIPYEDQPGFWENLPAQPRWLHHMPCPTFVRFEIPFTLNTDPPSVRDPRPVLTVISAVGRSPLEIDPDDWLNKGGATPAPKPVDYLVRGVHDPLGFDPAGPVNPMGLTIEQALCAMTFWAAYVSGQDREIGAFAVPPQGSQDPGWFADVVVWQKNPLAIQGPGGTTLDQVATSREGVGFDAARIGTVNAYIRGFRPAMTIVGGDPVYQA